MRSNDRWISRLTTLIHQCKEVQLPSLSAHFICRGAFNRILDCGSPAAAFPLHSLLWRLFSSSLEFQTSILSSRLLRSKRQQAAAVQGILSQGLLGIQQFLGAAGVTRNASRRSDVAYVAQSLRRLRFSRINVPTASRLIYGHRDVALISDCCGPHKFAAAAVCWIAEPVRWRSGNSHRRSTQRRLAG